LKLLGSPIKLTVKLDRDAAVTLGDVVVSCELSNLSAIIPVSKMKLQFLQHMGPASRMLDERKIKFM
jgi:hypothetical protein